MTRRAGLLSLAAWSASLALPNSRAHAWEHMTVEGRPDLPLFWTVPTVELRHAIDTVVDVSEEDAELALTLSTHAWEAATADCSSLQFVIGPPPTGTETNLSGGPRDAENRIVWRSEGWFDSDPNVLARTTVIYNKATGEELDADMDINASDFTWSTTDAPDLVEADLRNMLTHELGHVLGIAHTDDPDATMFGEALPAELNKRELSEDDIAAACSIYPLADGPPGKLVLTASQTCSANDLAPGVGCSTSGPWLTTLAGIGLAWRRLLRGPIRRARVR